MQFPLFLRTGRGLKILFNKIFAYPRLRPLLNPYLLHRPQREVWDQQRPEVGHLPWSSFRPNKGALGGGLEVDMYAARHCKVSLRMAVRRRVKICF